MVAVLKEQPQTSDETNLEALKADIDRRNPTPNERAIIAAELYATLPTRRGQRAAEIAAEIAGVSVARMNRMRRIMKLDPALFARVRSGEIAIYAAATSLQGDARKSVATSAERGAQVAELASRGASSIVIGEALGLSHERVWQIARRFGIKLPPARNNVSAEERIDQITALAKDGNRADQIAAQLKLSEQHVRRLAATHGITLVHHMLGNTHRFNPRKTIDNVVQGLEGDLVVIEAIKGAPFPDYEDAERLQLAQSLSRSLAALNWLRKQLRGYGR